MKYRDGTFNYDVDADSVATGLACLDVSLAQQSSQKECDINEIVRRFGLTGELPDNIRIPVVSDYDAIFDFQSAQNVLAEARQEFMRIPAEIRSRFNHDPQKFYDFCINPDNLDELRKLGLAKPKVEPAPEPAPMKVEVVNAAPRAPA